MSADKLNHLRIPGVSSIPGDQKVDRSNELKKSQVSDFKNLLKDISSKKGQDIKLSGHAQKRLKSRNIEFDSNEYLKIQDALNKLKTKGGKDSLVVTSKAAYVLDVNQGTIVTAVDKESMNENIFTKIDSTIFTN